MKRRTAILLYGFLYISQVFALLAAALRLILGLLHGIFKLALPTFVGGAVGCLLAKLWFQQLKYINTVSEEEWNRSWFINPSNER